MDQWRIMVLGERGVGKTALASQVSTHQFTHPAICKNETPLSSHSILLVVNTIPR
ncbi:hypothetical protein B0H19DRAFT_1171664 [Mycena capillaripes]|nr:hypothetical protein B0H19DRAFT_1171664 [Mycena capillaripes]